MADQNNQNPKDEAVQKGIAKLEAVKAIKQLQNPNSNWTVLQDILQDIMASHVVVDPNRMPPATKLVEQLKLEIEARYSDEADVKKLLLDAIPEVRSVREWLKKDGWDDAVWAKIRGDQLFSKDKRAQVIESLRLRAIEKSDNAAKIWLTLSGDYTEKVEVNEKTVDTFREINNILHNKKKNNSE